jgi:hypothetical protein
MSENPQNPGALDAPPATSKQAQQKQQAQHAPKASPPKKQRPLAPAQREPDASAPAEPRMQIVDDDDAVLIPELAPERLASISRYDPARAESRPGGVRALFFRRTMIPILLTCGLIFPSLAALWFSTEGDHVVRRTGLWLPVTFVVLGAVFLLLAVINMAQVRHLMTPQRPPATPR